MNVDLRVEETKYLEVKNITIKRLKCAPPCNDPLNKKTLLFIISWHAFLAALNK